MSSDSYIIDCGYNPNSTVDDDDTVGTATRAGVIPHYWRLTICVFLQGDFFDAVKVGYTIGHSVSLSSLTVAIIILCLFR